MNKQSYHRFVLLFLFLLSNCIIAWAQGNGKKARVEFEHFSLKDGLSHNTIFSILQDDLGFLWIGTGEGLNRYDGYKFTIFRNDKRQENSLLNNAIRNLFLDTQKRLWIGTERGISIYDRREERFQNFPLLNNNEYVRVNDFLEQDKNNYLIATSGGLYEFSIETGYKALFPNKKEAINVFLVFNGQIYYGGENGLFRYDPERKISIPVDSSLKEYSITALLPNAFDKTKCWIATEENGLILYDVSTQEKKYYTHEKSNENSLSSNIIRSICYDDNQRLWIGTFVGLNILNELTGNIEQYLNKEYSDSEVSQNSIRSIFKDTQGGMWCGTHLGGLNYYHPLRHQFEHYFYRQGRPSISDNVISAITEDDAGNIWIGTNDNGINVLNPETKTFILYEHVAGDASSISGNNVKAFCLDNNNKDIWIGLHNGGLCKYKASSKKFERIYFTSNKIANDKVYALLMLDENHILTGTLSGLYVFDKKENRAREFTTTAGLTPFKNKSVISLYQDTEKGIWVGTERGFARYSTSTGFSLDSRSTGGVNHDIQEQIYCFHEDRNRQIWIGASGGLYCYNLANGEYVDISELEFSGTSVYGILEDTFHRLWISTGDGLYMLDLNTEKTRRYGMGDGLQSDRFNNYSYYKSRNGKMYFGGIYGLNAFSPERLVDNPYSPTPIIDNLTVFNKKVSIGDKTGILKDGNITQLKKIRIPSKYSLFGLNFITPNYLSGKGNNTYAYKLEGFDKDWYYTKNTSVSYSNLNPGIYKFMVKSANNAGIWSIKPAELTVEVSPEWYQTWMLRISLLLLAGGLIYWLSRANINRRLMTRQLEMERKEKDRIKEMEQEKIRFFINVSHEFRTPLTLILSPVEEALKRQTNNKWLQKQLKLVQRNALRMLHLVNQVLDYRKAEMGAMKLAVRKVQIQELTQNIFDLFAELAAQKNMEYQFDCRINDEYIWIDPNYYERILSNLISNALKFTPEKGIIEVAIWRQDNHFYLEVHDSGCGIPYEKQAKIFDRFFQIEENLQGTGVGLSFVKDLVNKHHGEITVHSIPQEGSTFKVTLPCGEENYDENEKVTQTELDVVTEVSNDLSNNIALLQPENAETNWEEEDRHETSQKCILIIEDDKDIRNYLTENLSKQYAVVAAENGQEAWQKLQENKEVDLIISDVMMPIMNGITFCKELKRNIQTCHIPVILLTAKSEVSDQLEGLQTGADDYLSKPFVWSVLSAKITNIFKHKQRIIRHYLNNIEANVVELSTNTIDEEMLQKAKKTVLERMENPNFSVEELSREMGMSRSNLHLKMKAVTGESAIDFIRHVRLAEACRLLIEGKYNAAEISTIIGFTPSYFSTIFKKYIGCLPSEYAGKG